jgi:hypothetical protein
VLKTHHKIVGIAGRQPFLVMLERRQPGLGIRPGSSKSSLRRVICRAKGVKKRRDWRWVVAIIVNDYIE